MLLIVPQIVFILFFFTNPSPTDTYTLSLHDALPISRRNRQRFVETKLGREICHRTIEQRDRKSTRLNSSHRTISYAVFCLKKKKGRIRFLAFYVLCGITAGLVFSLTAAR